MVKPRKPSIETRTHSSRALGESIVRELKSLIKKLKFQRAIWEWSLALNDSPPRLNFLRITLDSKASLHPTGTLLENSSISLCRANTPIRFVLGFLDYCLSTRKQFDKTNTLPVKERGFPLGDKRPHLFGNFPAQHVELVGSTRAREYWNFKTTRPFFLAEYALHDSVRPRLPYNLSFYDADPPLENLREAYLHHFAADIGNRQEPWIGIVLPVHLSYIDSFSVTSTELQVSVASQVRLQKNLKLAVVCRGANHVLRKSVVSPGLRTTLKIGFEPESLDLALFLGDLRLDFVEWRPRNLGLLPILSDLTDLTDHAPIFDTLFLSKLPADIRRCLEQVEECGSHNLWVPASLMLRKTLDMATSLKLKQLGRESDLYDGSGQEKSFRIRLQLLVGALPALQRDMRDLHSIKWFGDKGAHTRMDIYENDVRSLMAPRLRAFLADLDLKPA
jgi:hypothetical protein